MSNYQARVTTVVDFGQLSQLESRLNSLKNTQIKINLNGINMGSGSSSMTNIGKQMGVQIQNGLKASKFTPNLIDYAQMKQQTQKQIAGYSNQIQSGLKGVSKSSANSWAKSYASDLQKQTKTIQTLQSRAQASSDKLSSLQSQANSSKVVYENATGYQKMVDYIGKAQAAQSKLNAEMAKGSKADLSKMSSHIKEFESAVKGADTQFNGLNQSISLVDSYKASNNTLTWLKNNSKAAKIYGEELTRLAEKQKMATTAGESQALQKQVNLLKSDASAHGLTGMSMFDNFKRGASQIGQFVGVYRMFQMGIQTAGQMANAVIDVDTAMTELRKVSDAPSSQIDSYFEVATESAKKYGSTISDVISSTSDWSRLGYGLKDASKLSDVTTLFQKVGDNMTQESASQSLVSTLQGYELDADQAKSVLDKYNSVANNYAIDTAGIGEALQNSASSFNAANTDLSKSIALITGTNEVAQDPSAVGNMWKTKLNKNCLYVQKCA